MDCVLHIGSPKTGTTALQQTLADSRTALRSSAVLYPEAGTSLTKRGRSHERQIGLRVAMAAELPPQGGFERVAGLTDPKSRRAYRARFVRQFDRELGAGDPVERVVLSDESLFRYSEPAMVEALAHFLDERFDNVLVVAYLRRPDRFLESWYSQQIKSGGAVTLRAYVEDQWRLAEYDQPLEEWAAAFGRDRIRIVWFDSSNLADASIVSDFRKRFELPEFAKVSRTSNESLSEMGSAILRQVNRIHHRRGVPRPAALRSAVSNHVTGPSLRLDQSARRALGDHLAPSHDRLVTRFGACIDGPFYALLDDLEHAPLEERAASISPSVARSIAGAIVEAYDRGVAAGRGSSG